MSADPRRLRLGRPLWLPATPPKPRYRSLAGTRETSIAVVGGGMTGALVAHAFATAGIATILLESSTVGSGSTAASSALLLQEPDLGLTELSRRYGARAGRRIWRISQESARQLVALLNRLGIACDLQRRDAIYYATDAASEARLRRERDVRGRSGFALDWLGPGDLRRTTGISGRAAIRTRGGAQFDPYRASVGIMAAAAAAGAEVFERSAVRRIEARGDGVRIHTRAGLVVARRVVIATGYATARFRPLAGRFQMHRTYVVVTEPTTARQREELGLSDVMLWNTERPYHYARWTADQRLLLGGSDRRVRPGPGRRRQFETATRELRAYFEASLPALTGIATHTAWEGLFAVTPDSLPFIGPHRRYPKHWFALGYGGNGMTFGFLAARQLLERWHGAATRDHALFEFGRMR